MTEAERRLHERLGGGDSLELLPGGQVSRSAGVGAELSQIVGNPGFKAEINITASVRFYSQAVVGTPVAVLWAALPLAQQVPVPVYVFGQADRQANYARARATVPAGAGWNMVDAAVYVGGNTASPCYKPLPHAAGAVDYALGSVFNNLVQNGDLLIAIPMVGFVAGAAATTITAEVLIHCNNVAYVTLLDSLSSDLITLNMIRYTVAVADVAQLANQLTLIVQSLFGKASTDTLDPTAFITSQTFNPNIADIPIRIPVDKNFILATSFGVGIAQFTWTMTVQQIIPLTNRPKA